MKKGLLLLVLAWFLILGTVAQQCTQNAYQRCLCSSGSPYCPCSSLTETNVLNFATTYRSHLVLVSGQGCRPCPPNCLKCSSLTVCSECMSAFELSGGRCLVCPINCGSCANGVCVVCLQGYYLDYQANCQSCPIAGTKVCTISSLISCLSNYYLDNNAAGCLQCDPHCQMCSSTTKCSLCLSGYYLSLQYSCSPCSSSCATCSSQNTCLMCSNSSLFFDSASENCIPGTASHCLVFSSLATCLVCDNASYLNSSSQCSPLISSQLVSGCLFYSMLANGTLICANCSAGLFNLTGVCSYGCSVLCSSCFGAHYGLCYDCQTNSVLANMQCIPQYNIEGGAAFQLYYTAFNQPSFFTPSSLANADACIPQTIIGPSMSTFVSLSRLQSYKATLKWKVYVYNIVAATNNGSTSYATTFNNSESSSTQVYTLTYTVGACSTLTFAGKQQITVYGLKDDNTLTFTTSSGYIGISELLVVGYRCGGIQGAQCLECSSTSQCTKCLNPKYYIYGYNCQQACPSGAYLRSATSTCLDSCPSGTYPQHADLLCLECPSPCLTCSSPSICLSCLPNYYLLGSACLVACPSGYYGDSLKKSCELCLRPCLSCSSNLKCLSCLSGFYRAESNSCVLSCGQGNFGNISSLACELCVSPCLTCSQYAGTTCLTCQPGYFYFVNQCLGECPAGYIAAGALCVNCDAQCKTCMNLSSVCVSCRKGKYLFNATCLDSCPSSYFSNSVEQLCSSCPLNCLSCLNSQQCFSCLGGYYLYSGNHTCLQKCPEGSFGQLDACVSCQLPCLSCLTSTECLSCSGLFQFNHTCLSQCPSGYFADTASMACLPCDSNLCLECALSADSCTSCPSQLILFASHCLSTCAMGYYLSISGNCERCPENCYKCSSQSQCDLCLSEYVLLQGLCSKNCTTGYYQLTVNSALSCDACPCSACQLVNSSVQCTSCSIGLYLYTGQCLSQCPTHFYPYLTQCFPCQSPCLACSSETVCSSCSVGFFLGGSCLTQCPLSFFSLSNSCIPCSSSCLKCEYSASNCTACSSGLFVQEYSCLSECSKGFYLSSSGNICRKCSTACSACRGTPSTCSECSNNSLVLTNDHCLEQCSTGYYLDPLIPVCQPCPLGCLDCLNTSSCLSCLTNYYLRSDHSCQTDCLQGFYPFGGLCRLCTYPCLSCSDFRTCLSCLSGYFYSGECLSACPASTYLYNNKCDSCPDNCSQCLSGSECLQCRVGVLVGGTCLGSCPIGFYSYYSICAPCMYGCLLCSDSSNCFSCSTGFLHMGRCLTLCPSGWVGMLGQCTKCSENCLTCIVSQYQCLTCASGLFLYIFQCLSACPLGTYPDYPSSSCVTCPTPCATCQNGYSCTSCIYGYILYAQPSGNQCIQGPQCPNSYYLDLQGNQCVFACPSSLFLQPLKATCSTPCPSAYVSLLSNRTCLQACPPGMWIDEFLMCSNGNSPALLPSFDCSALVVRNLLVIDCLFSTAIDNLQELTTNNFSMEGVALTKIIFASDREIRLVTSPPTSQVYQNEYLTVALTCPYQLRAGNMILGKVLGTSGLPVQNYENKVFIKQYHTYSRDQRRTGLQLMQMAQSVCVGALIFWLLAVLKNLKATSLTFFCTLQWLHSLSLIDITLPPNIGQFLEGFRFANLFFGSYSQSSTIWTISSSYRAALWGVVNYFDVRTTVMPSFLLGVWFLLAFALAYLLYHLFRPHEEDKQKSSKDQDANEQVQEGSEEKEEPSLISNVPSKEEARQTLNQELNQPQSGPKITAQLGPERRSIEESGHSLMKTAELSDNPQCEEGEGDWKQTKIKMAQKCKIIIDRFKFNYCFHLLLLTTSPVAIGFYCQLIAPNPLGLALSILLALFYLSVGIGVGRWALGGGRLFVSSKFALLGWIESLILNGLVVCGTSQIYIGVSLLVFLVNMYVWSRIFSSKRHQKLRYYHQIQELVRCLILLEVLVVYTKTKVWEPTTLYDFSWIIIITTFFLIILAAVHSTKQFFNSEPQQQQTEEAFTIQHHPDSGSVASSKSSGKNEKGSSRNEGSFVFSGSLKEQSEEEVVEGSFFTERQGEWQSDSSEEDIIDFDGAADAFEAPKELIRLQKNNKD